MSNEGVAFTVIGTVSRHNSPKDAEHDELWADLKRRVDAIVDEDQYAKIHAMLVD